MNDMFYGCSSLTNLNLSNFKTNNVTDLNLIFYGCKKLTKDNIIVYDKKILEKLKYL